MTPDLLQIVDVEGLEHVVNDPAMAVARAARSGRYVTMCGVLIIGASLTAPPERLCSVCISWAE